MTVRWKDEAWNEYVNWQTEDKKTLKRINKLIKSVNCNNKLNTYAV